MIPYAKVVALAQKAGDAIMRIYEEADHGVEMKGDNDPLTRADLESHRIIMEGLAKLTPDIPVISEEGEEVEYADRYDWTRFWLVDPLDGTKEFIKRNGEFTVNIALVAGKQPMFGVVHVPVEGVTYVGGSGAHKIVNGEATEITVQPQTTPLRVVGSRSHTSPEMDAFLENLGEHEFVAAGSSLKFCRVAEGSADLYPRFVPTMEWDTAAGHAVLVSAGGSVRRADGGPFNYNKENLLNPFFIASGQGIQKDE